MATRPEATPAPPHTPPPFVEVPSAPACSPLTAPLTIELERPDGTRLRLHSPDASLPLAAIVQSLVEAR